MQQKNTLFCYSNIYKKQILKKNMLNLKEIPIVVITSIVLAFSLTLVRTSYFGLGYLITLGLVLLVLLVNIFAKKITAYYYESKIEIRLWEMQRYGFKPHKKLKKPFPVGILFPILSTIFLFPLRGIVWMASIVSDIEPEVYSAAKRHSLYTFSEIPEKHIGIIAASGVIANLVFAFLGYLIGATDFSRINIYYAFFNLIPISNLDGNKIFFGSLLLWAILGFISVLSLVYTFIL